MAKASHRVLCVLSPVKGPKRYDRSRHSTWQSGLASETEREREGGSLWVAATGSAPTTFHWQRLHLFTKGGKTPWGILRENACMYVYARTLTRVTLGVSSFHGQPWKPDKHRRQLIGVEGKYSLETKGDREVREWEWQMTSGCYIHDKPWYTLTFISIIKFLNVP